MSAKRRFERVLVLIKPAQRKAIRAAALAGGISENEIIRRALDFGLPETARQLNVEISDTTLGEPQDKSNMRRPGIYAIVNGVNNKVYVGAQIVGAHLRWMAHRALLRRGAHTNLLLQQDWSELGESAFEFVILEVLKDATALPIEREAYWMQRYRDRLYNTKWFDENKSL
jgi:hypothetical protein